MDVTVYKLATDMKDGKPTGSYHARKILDFDWSRRLTFPHPQVRSAVEALAKPPPGSIIFRKGTVAEHWVWCEELNDIDWDRFIDRSDMWRYELLRAMSGWSLKFGLLLTKKSPAL